VLAIVSARPSGPAALRSAQISNVLNGTALPLNSAIFDSVAQLGWNYYYVDNTNNLPSVASVFNVSLTVTSGKALFYTSQNSPPGFSSTQCSATPMPVSQPCTFFTCNPATYVFYFAVYGFTASTYQISTVAVGFDSLTPGQIVSDTSICNYFYNFQLPANVFRLEIPVNTVTPLPAYGYLWTFLSQSGSTVAYNESNVANPCIVLNTPAGGAYQLEVYRQSMPLGFPISWATTAIINGDGSCNINQASAKKHPLKRIARL